MPPRTYVNPVHPSSFADPFVWRHEGGFLAVGTGPCQAGPAASVFPLMRSPDLVHWTPAGCALVRPDAALGTDFWAPEVVQAEGRWWLYYSVGFGDRAHQLRVACSDSACGPYHDCAQLTDPREQPFAIDPHPFRGPDGRWVLFYARDFLDEHDDAGRPTRPGTALVVQPLDGMTRLAREGARTVARARHDWQRFQAGRAMYGRVFDWHTLEGPFVAAHAGRYWCLYSGGCWQTPGYGVDYVVADALLGPWHDEGAEAGPRVLRSVPDHVLGPGHCSVVTGPDGRTQHLAYHAWDLRADHRRLCIDPLQFTPAGPRSPGPSWSEQAMPLADAPKERP